MASVKKNFLYSGFLMTANYLFALLVFPYVTRVLGVEGIGVCNFVDGIINYFILLSTMGISVIGIRDIAACLDSRKKRDSVFSTMVAMNGIATAIMLGILVAATITVPKLRENYDLMIFGAFKLVFTFMLIEWFYRGIEDFRYITLRTFVVKCAYVLLVFLLVRDRDDVGMYYVLTCGMVVVNAVINMIYSRRFVTFRLSSIDFKSIIKPYFIYGVYAILNSLYTTFNVVYLGFVSDDEQVGYYTTATRLFIIFIAFFQAFAGVMMPRMSALIAEGKIEEFKGKYRRTTDVITAMTMPIMFFAIALAPQIIRLIAGPGYEGSIMPMRIVMPLLFIIGSEQILVIQALMPLGKDKMVFRNAMIGAVVGVSGNVLLVPFLQAIGSSIVWLSCEFVVFCLSQWCVNKCIGEQLKYGMTLKYMAAYMPLIGLYGLSYIETISQIAQLGIGCVIALAYFVTMQSMVFKHSACTEELRKLGAKLRLNIGQSCSRSESNAR